MTDIDITRSFPEAEPIKGPPSLGSINGFGFGMSGQRDLDEETGLYVKTLCFTLLFIPVLSLRSYVVANGEQGGWYFLARVPVSGFAKIINMVVLVAVLSAAAGFGWVSYTGSPEYKAKQQLAQAEDAADKGDAAEAARLYRKVAESGTGQAAEGEKQLIALTEALAATGPAMDLAVGMEVTIDYTLSTGAQSDHDWVGSAIQAVRDLRDENPDGLLAVLDAVKPLVTETQRDTWFKARLAPLERLVKVDPSRIDMLSELALAYEAQGDREKARELLLPHKDKLGDSEGARVLGNILLSENQLADACKLLEAYASSRINLLQATGRAWDTAYENAYERAFNQLDNGLAPDSWYQRYEIASEQVQQEMVDEWINKKMSADRALNEAREAYTEVSGVIDVALDLGVAQLNLAQGLPDPAERRMGLEQAEKTFLSIQDSAGDSATYRLYLGQVYFWLGRADEGHELFNAYLAEYPDSPGAMMSVARTLRQVGEQEKSVTLFEKAYESTEDQDWKYDIAAALAAMAAEREDKVKWLRLCSPENKSAQAALKNSLGVDAADAGEDDKALALFDEAVAIYDSLTESSSTLNNSALVLLERFATSNDVSDRDKALDRLVKAVELEPSGTVLLSNTASTLLNAVMYDLMAPHMDMQALELNGSLGALSYIYEDRAQWQAMVAKMKATPRFNNAVSMFERVVLLAPKRPDAYETLANVYNYIEDEPALESLLKRAKAAEPDYSADIQSVRLYRSGHYDEMSRTRSKTSEERLRKTLERSDLNPATRSAASLMLAGTLVARHVRDEPVDSEEALSLAESAWKLKQSSAARSTLQTVLSFRILERFSKNDQAVRETWQKLNRVHSNRKIIAILLDQNPGLRSAMKEDVDMQRLLALRADQRQRFPDSASTSLWAITRYMAPQVAAIEAELVEAEQYDRLARELYVELSPYSADAVWNASWAYEIAGNTERAREVIEAYKALGLDN